METLFYPNDWVEEYIHHGFPEVWLADFPKLFVKTRGVYPPDQLPRTTRYCFADYALMYLLRSKGIESITYYRLAVKNSEAIETPHPVMHEWMGRYACDKLQQALWSEGITNYGGEPDLFCWRPETGDWFFAEAKGPGDKIRKPQKRWFSICGQALPGAKIIPYFLLPETKLAMDKQPSRTRIAKRARSEMTDHSSPDVLSPETLRAALAKLSDTGSIATMALSALLMSIETSSLRMDWGKKWVTIFHPSLVGPKGPIGLATVYKTPTKGVVWAWSGQSFGNAISPTVPKRRLDSLLQSQRELFESFGGVLVPDDWQINIPLHLLLNREEDFVRGLETLVAAIISAASNEARHS
jgi:hypothetical protein